MTNIISYISDTLCSHKIIKYEEIDIFKYGLQCFTISVLEILSILVISLFVGNFLYTVIFFLAFIPLRMYAGGYHADTKLKCYIVLLIVYITFSVLMNFITYDIITIVIPSSAIITILTILKYSPIINKKKKVNSIEKNNYRKISIVILFAELIIIFSLSFVFTNSKYILSFSLGQSAVSLSMLMALVKI